MAASELGIRSCSLEDLDGMSGSRKTHSSWTTSCTVQHSGYGLQVKSDAPKQLSNATITTMDRFCFEMALKELLYEEIDTDDDGIDDIDGAQEDEVALQSDGCSVDYIADGLRELDMENYDDDDGVIKDLCSGSSDLYYPSNDMDPYLKNKNNGLVSILEEMEDGHPYLYPYDEIVLLGIPLCVPLSDCGLMDGQKDEKIQDWKPETLYLIGIDWNKEYTNILASASADKTVKIWDVAADYCVLQVSLENGMVQTFDKRITSSHQNGTVPMFTLHAHEMAVLSISFCPSVPNVKLWDISSNQPSVIASLNPKVGAIFSISFSKDNPFLLAVGGQKGNLKVWNTLTEPLVANKIGKHGSS
ncbi:hypothetical protein OsI_23103 [Oryza sativa Indica Group]|uniref:Uncharacterized protein n=1 Tax=Oryza sativa subsp. indica TaxID=39946 RepID=A2YDB3_ORYSI|nr:hypothetical protein OsI_23103 [Oryza sativa Indica Group]